MSNDENNQNQNPLPNEFDQDFSDVGEVDRSVAIAAENLYGTSGPLRDEPIGFGTSRQAMGVLKTYLEVRPISDSHIQAVKETSKRLGVGYTRVVSIIQQAQLHREAKKQRREYADKIYAEKIPFAQLIVGKSLKLLDNFLTTFSPQTIEDAKGLSKVATDITNLLRLELGKPTQQIEFMHKTHKSVTVIMDDLRKADPFVEYPEAPAGVDVKTEAPDRPAD